MRNDQEDSLEKGWVYWFFSVVISDVSFMSISSLSKGLTCSFSVSNVDIADR